MWTVSPPRTKRSPGAFAVRSAGGSRARRVVGIATNVPTRKGSSAGAGRHLTRSARPDSARAAGINGVGLPACGVAFGLCMRTGTRATTDDEHKRA